MSDPSPAFTPSRSRAAPGTLPAVALMAATLIAAIAWLTFAAEIDITVTRLVGRGGTVFDGLGRLTNYLTNLTVFVTAVCFSCVALRGRSGLSRFFESPAVITAAVIYIVFVGLAYNLLLRGLWTPVGYRFLVNESQHSILPLLAVAYWLRFVPRFAFTARTCLLWLVYPLGYLFITLWRGSVSGFYPYFFIDVTKLGYPRVLINSACLLMAFLLLMGLFVAINQRRQP